MNEAKFKSQATQVSGSSENQGSENHRLLYMEDANTRRLLVALPPGGCIPITCIPLGFSNVPAANFKTLFILIHVFISSLFRSTDVIRYLMLHLRIQSFNIY